MSLRFIFYIGYDTVQHVHFTLFHIHLVSTFHFIIVFGKINLTQHNVIFYINIFYLVNLWDKRKYTSLSYIDN